MYDYEGHESIDFSNAEPGKYRRSGKEVRIIRTEDIYQVDPEEDMSVYSPRVVELAGRFERAGIPEGCNAASMAGVSKHGERAVQLFAVIDPETETFVRAGFRCRGDVAAIAAASLAVECVEGKTIDEALAISGDDLKKELGKMPPDRVTRPYLAAVPSVRRSAISISARGVTFPGLTVACRATSAAWLARCASTARCATSAYR